MVWPTNKKKKQKYSILTFCSFKTCIGYAFLIHFFFLQNYGLFRTFVTAPRRNDNHWFRFRSRTPEMTVCWILVLLKCCGRAFSAQQRGIYQIIKSSENGCHWFVIMNVPNDAFAIITFNLTVTISMCVIHQLIGNMTNTQSALNLYWFGRPRYFNMFFCVFHGLLCHDSRHEPQPLPEQIEKNLSSSIWLNSKWISYIFRYPVVRMKLDTHNNQNNSIFSLNGSKHWIRWIKIDNIPLIQSSKLPSCSGKLIILCARVMVVLPLSCVAHAIP